MSLKRIPFWITLGFMGLSACTTTSSLTPSQLSATTQQYALVVGINEYSPSSKVTQPLEGAVNDASLIRDQLRNIQVLLPDERVLLDSQATRAKVIGAWRQMTSQAKAGDTLIFTYAGHGSQIEDEEPLDEVTLNQNGKDGKDETLELYDNAITDDELIQLFSEAKQFNIVFVADSCHSGGLRSKGVSRVSPVCRYTNDSSTDPQKKREPHLTVSTLGDEEEKLTHVTFITAQHYDKQEVCEITQNGERHGALSWSFAEALTEGADKNQNHQLERTELSIYLKEHVQSLNQVQLPEVQPANNQSVIALLGEKVNPPSPPPRFPNLPDVAVRVKNGSPPAGLTRYRLVQDNQFDLLFVIGGKQTEVFYNTGVRSATDLDSQDATQWQRIINKKLLLQALYTQFDMKLTPVRIELTKGNHQLARIDELHKEGERLHFSVSPQDPQDGLNALTLFDLTGNGELQLLYPLKRLKDSSILTQFPYSLELEVQAPFGGDHLVAILCDKPPRELQKLLIETQQSFVPDPNQVIATLHQQSCQVGQYAFFSCGRSEEGCF